MDNPNILVANIGVITNANLPLFKIPTGFGGLTVLGMQETFLTAGTAQLYLVDMGTAGTAVAGTIATGGGTAHAAKTPVAATINTAFVDEGHYIGIKEGNVGSTVTVTEVAISYAWGK